MAEIPAPTLAGVQRVVIACDFDSTLSEVERGFVCQQLVKKAQSLTSLPVAAATPSDSVSGDLDRLAQQLLLRVRISAIDAGASRKQLNLAVTPVRTAMPQGEMPTLPSTASLVKVQNDWIVQGPVEAFVRLLAEAPRGLHTPIVSEF
jgi:hypothetical protein